MTTTRWTGSVAAFVLAYACAIDAAWSADAPPPTPTQPNATADSNGTAPTQNTKADGQATKPAAPPKSTQSTATPDDKNRDFKPSEDISEDMSVAYPSDI